MHGNFKCYELIVPYKYKIFHHEEGEDPADKNEKSVGDRHNDPLRRWCG